MVEKKNPDYSESAENLRNPPEVKELLVQLHAYQGTLSILENELKAQNVELTGNIEESTKAVMDIQTRIKVAVEAQGSYQDIETGDYAVKYRRMMRSYSPEALKDEFPKFAPLLIEETVNAKALEGQIKGGLLSLDELKKKGVITETPQYAFYVR